MSAELLMTPGEITADPPRWLATRRRGITASEIAAVLGIAPPGQGSPFALFTEKQTGESLIGDSDEMTRGRHLEPYVAEVFGKARQDLDLYDGGLYRAAARPWQMATFDRLAIERDGDGYRKLAEQMSANRLAYGTVVPVQIKTSATFEDWGDDDTDQVPVHYRAQALWELDVADAERVIVPCLFMQTWQLRVYVIERDERDIRLMREAAAEFMQRLADDNPPEIDWTPATTKALKSLHPKVEDREVRVPLKLARRYRAWKLIQAKANRELGQATNEILALMGSAKYAATPTRGVDAGRYAVATRSVFPRTDTDAKLLKQRYPHVHKEVERTTEVSALRASKWSRGES